MWLLAFWSDFRMQNHRVLLLGWTEHPKSHPSSQFIFVNLDVTCRSRICFAFICKTIPDQKFTTYIYGSFFFLSHFQFQTICCKLCKLMLTILLFNLFSLCRSNLRPNSAKGRFGSSFVKSWVKFFPTSQMVFPVLYLQIVIQNSFASYFHEFI